MNRGIKPERVSKYILFIVAFLFASMSSFATENSIAGINIKQTQNDNYKIILKLDKKAQIKKSIDENGNLILSLSETLPSESMEIIYDSANNLTDVIVQKKNDDNTVIFVQGENIKNAEIYTKELSTGITKELNSDNNFIFIADKKLVASSVFVMFLLFLIRLGLRPKNKRYNANSVNNITKSKHTNVNTLRNKNLVQSKNIPSINYKVNGSFNSINATVSTPKDFITNKNIRSIEEQQIRKVG